MLRLRRGITCYFAPLILPPSPHSSLISLKNMKIFNWVHRRFINSRAAENGKENVGIGGELGDQSKGNVLECWGGGILTIGTFGYDSLKDEFCHDLVCDEEEEEELAMEAQGHYDDDDSEEEEEEDDDENPNLGFGGYDEEEEEEDLVDEKRREELGFKYVMMEKKARTTLADLFHQDTAASNKQEFMIKDNYSKCKHKKKKMMMKKQLLLDQLRPIHKLNKVMRRLLRRKIHPADIGADHSKLANCDINDHASLLIPTYQDVII